MTRAHTLEFLQFERSCLNSVREIATVKVCQVRELGMAVLVADKLKTRTCEYAPISFRSDENFHVELAVSKAL